MPMAHQPLAAVFGLSVGVAAQEGCDLGLDSLRQQRSRALAQNFGERIGEGFWLNQLGNIILDHGVSLLWWRSGGSNTPTIRRLNPSPRHQLPRIPPNTSTKGASVNCTEERRSRPGHHFSARRSEPMLTDYVVAESNPAKAEQIIKAVMAPKEVN